MSKEITGGCCCESVAFKLKDDFDKFFFVTVNSAESLQVRLMHRTCLLLLQTSSGLKGKTK